MANAVLVQADAHSMQCQSTKLVVYKVTFSTFWNREKFPKQYPEFRPPAQWTKLVGKIQKKRLEVAGLVIEGRVPFLQFIALLYLVKRAYT